jgi:hypothetical protein
MPYSGPGDESLPDNVKEMPEGDRAQWVEVFNSAMKSCLADGGGQDACETSAFKQANGMMKKGERGGPGSGNFGHAGRPGEIGGSDGGGALLTGASIVDDPNATSMHWNNEESITGDTVIELPDDIDASEVTKKQLADFVRANIAETETAGVQGINSADDIEEVSISNVQVAGGNSIVFDFEIVPTQEAAESYYSSPLAGRGRSKRRNMASKEIGIELTINKQSFIDKIVGAFTESLEVIRGTISEMFAERKIKDVASWDGAASNYADTNAYCAACLIDVNSAAGRDEKAQDHCMLPVRGPGDGSDIYVKQAVHAAAGGHGVSQVKRPSDVPEDAWSSAVKVAAGKLISAYGQMEEEVPDSLYEAAGKTPPKKGGRKRQGENLIEKIESVRAAIQQLYNTPNDYSYWVSEVYEDYAIVEHNTKDGIKCYKVPYSTNGNSRIEIAPQSEWIEGSMEFVEGQRATSLNDLYSDGRILQMLETAGIRPIDMYMDRGMLYAVGAQEGKLLKVPIVINDEDGSIALGEMQQVIVDFPPIGERGISVSRQADGRVRLSGIACTAILNRSGEIDARSLFDNFLSHFQAGRPVHIDLMHLDGSDVGRVDFLARDGYSLIYSALLDSDGIGEAIGRGLESDPGFWGNSILYKPLGNELVDVGGVNVRAFTSGILHKITILPEHDAAALFTVMEVKRMNETIKNALKKLLGSDELVDEMEKRVDGVNARVRDESLVAREGETPAQQDPPAQNPPVAPPAPSESEAVITVRRSLDEVTARLDLAIETIKALAETVETRLGALERTDEDRRRAWLNDLPEKKRQVQAPIWRPRENAQQAGGEPEPANAQAERILKSKGGK